MKKIELNNYLRSSCELLKPSPATLIEIYNLSNGNPCRGCACAANCKVKHDLELKTVQEKRRPKRHLGETNQQTAGRLGISKRQVAKMRKNGEL